MPEIRYPDLDAYLKKTQENDLASIYLICGDDYLYQNAADLLIRKILPETDRNIAFEVFDGENENIVKAIEQLNTYNLLSTKKVVAIRDCRIFYSQQESDRIYEKARLAFFDQDIEKACAHFVAYLAVLNLNFEDLEEENRYSDEGNADDEKWLDQVIGHCREKKMVVPSGQNIADRLAVAVKKGFPRGNRLIMTTDFVDKRRLLYQAIKDNGVVIDCFVPKGVRKADKDAQNVLMNDALRALLAKHGKTMDPGAIAALIEKSGFDLRIFTANIEKLIDYAGKQSRITTGDVDSVLNRTKIDPIFELTNAVSDRNAEKSLFFLNSLLSSDFHPLQVLAALANQFRKLLAARSFLDKYKQSVQPNMNLNEFKSRMLPVILQADNALIEEIDRWNDAFGIDVDGDGEGQKTKKAKARKMFSTELAIAKNPNNLYPILQIVRQAGNFSAKELALAITHLHQADRRIKTSPVEPKLVVEKAIVDILSGAGITGKVESGKCGK
jgi:DNA polymerase III subunit delta